MCRNSTEGEGRGEKGEEGSRYIHRHVAVKAINSCTRQDTLQLPSQEARRYASAVSRTLQSLCETSSACTACSCVARLDLAVSMNVKLPTFSCLPILHMHSCAGRQCRGPHVQYAESTGACMDSHTAVEGAGTCECAGRGPCHELV